MVYANAPGAGRTGGFGSILWDGYFEVMNEADHHHYDEMEEKQIYSVYFK